MEFRSIKAIVRALEEASVRYLIVRGLAVNAHGFSRMTHDVDLVMQLESSNTQRGLVALLRARYRLVIAEKPEAFADPAVRERWRTEKGMIVLK